MRPTLEHRMHMYVAARVIGTLAGMPKRRGGRRKLEIQKFLARRLQSLASA